MAMVWWVTRRMLRRACDALLQPCGNRLLAAAGLAQQLDRVLARPRRVALQRKPVARHLDGRSELGDRADRRMHALEHHAARPEMRIGERFLERVDRRDAAVGAGEARLPMRERPRAEDRR